jgi:hypothetical protein
MPQAYTTRTAKGSALTHTELDNNFNTLGTGSGVRFNALGVGVNEGAAGTITATSMITAYSSDQRLKKNFIKIQDPIGKLALINGYEFDWDQELCEELGFNYINVHEHGVKAQEILGAIPDAVELAPFDRADAGGSKSGQNYLTVNYPRIIPLLIEVAKAQQQEIEALKRKLENK